MSAILLADEVDANNCIQATALCKTLGNALIAAYPKRKWYVDVNWEGKVAWICCPEISMQYGFCLHLDKLIIDVEKAAVMAGGELLERFQMSRNFQASGGTEHLIRDARGNALVAAQGGV